MQAIIAMIIVFMGILLKSPIFPFIYFPVYFSHRMFLIGIGDIFWLIGFFWLMSLIHFKDRKFNLRYLFYFIIAIVIIIVMTIMSYIFVNFRKDSMAVEIINSIKLYNESQLEVNFEYRKLFPGTTHAMKISGNILKDENNYSFYIDNAKLLNYSALNPITEVEHLKGFNVEYKEEKELEPYFYIIEPVGIDELRIVGDPYDKQSVREIVKKILIQNNIIKNIQNAKKLRYKGEDIVFERKAEKIYYRIGKYCDKIINPLNYQMTGREGCVLIEGVVWIDSETKKIIKNRLEMNHIRIGKTPKELERWILNSFYYEEIKIVSNNM